MTGALGARGTLPGKTHCCWALTQPRHGWPLSSWRHFVFWRRQRMQAVAERVASGWGWGGAACIGSSWGIWWFEGCSELGWSDDGGVIRPGAYVFSGASSAELEGGKAATWIEFRGAPARTCPRN